MDHLTAPRHGGPPNTRSACMQLFEAFVDGPAGASAVVLASADGQLIAAARRVDIDLNRVAALGGSMLALSEACIRELGEIGCRNTIVESEAGLTVFQRIPRKEGWALTTIGRADTRLGTLYTHSRHLAEELSRLAPDAFTTPSLAHPPDDNHERIDENL